MAEIIEQAVTLTAPTITEVDWEILGEVVTHQTSTHQARFLVGMAEGFSLSWGPMQMQYLADALVEQGERDLVLALLNALTAAIEPETAA